MLDTITDRERLTAPGRPIILADGSEHIIRFDFRAVSLLEEQFGSLAEFTTALNQRDDAGNPTGPILTVIRKAIAAALDRDGITYEQLGELLEIPRRFEYLDSVIGAYNQAFASADSAGKASAAANPSRGGASTSTPPSATDDPTISSGG